MFPHYITAGGPRTERRTMKRNFNNLLRTFFISLVLVLSEQQWTERNL